MSRYTPPMRIARVLTSPALPPILPRNISSALKPSAGFAPVEIEPFTPANGVALVIALMSMSTACPKNENRFAPLSRVMGDTKLVITPVQQRSRNIRAVIAGLAKFLPMPPKSILTTTIAKNPPTMGT